MDSGELDNPTLNRYIRNLQKVITGQMLEIRQNNCQYAILIEEQRQIILKMRKAILYTASATDFFVENSQSQSAALLNKMGTARFAELCRCIALYYTDQNWSNYLTRINDIRERIHLNRLGGQDPYYEFQKTVISLFTKLLKQSDADKIAAFNQLTVTNASEHLTQLGIKAPSSTWTYLINDNPFEDMFGINLIGNIGLSVEAGIYGPLMALYPLLRKLGKWMQRRRFTRTR